MRDEDYNFLGRVVARNSDVTRTYVDFLKLYKDGEITIPWDVKLLIFDEVAEHYRQKLKDIHEGSI